MAITSIKTGSSFTNLVKYNDFLGPNSAYIPPSYDSIATVTVNSGGTSSINFTSIPSTYTHLQVRSISKSNGFGPALVIRYNGDTSSNYKSHYSEGNGASIYGGTPGNTTYGYVGYPTPGAANASMFATTIIDILDYTNTNKYKTTRGLSGYDTNNTVDGYVDLFSNLWMSTSAISSITLTIQGESFVTGSSFALYGIKGS